MLCVFALQFTMKTSYSATMIACVIVIAVGMAAAERDYPAASGPSVEETNYGLLRHMRPGSTLVNLHGGPDARDEYRLRKIQDRHADKAGVNQFRRRRSADDVPDSDDRY